MYAAKSPERCGFGRWTAIAFLALACGGVSTFLVHWRFIVSPDETVRTTPAHSKAGTGGGYADHQGTSKPAQRCDLAETIIDETRRAPTRALTFEHDFGLVRPHDRVTHIFTVHNDGASAWSLRHVERTCVCTLARCPPVILQGETAEIEVEYRAAGSAADDRRVIELYFHEPDAPVVRFEVQVAIRPPIVPSRKELIFRGFGKGYRADESFEVDNFSGADWTSLGVATEAPWARARAELCRLEESAFGPRQVWKVHMHVDASDVKAGRHNATLELRCDGAAAQLPIWLDLLRPVTAVPERLFFGSIDAEGKGSCTVLLKCTACTAEELARRLVVRHDLGERLKLDVAVRSSNVLELAGTVQLSENSSAISGAVMLEIGDADETRIELPVVGER